MKHQSRIVQLTLILIASASLILTACSEDLPTAPRAGESQLGAVASGAAPANDAAGHRYEVTIENLTGGQPLSPGVIATHTKQLRLFEVGEAASEGIRLIAEEGNPTTAVADASTRPEAHDVQSTGAPVGPGGSLTVEVEGRANANRLSLAIMLVCTNDGFTGLSGVKLPGGFKADTYYTNAYDAGTESNEETSETIVDGCGLGNDGNARPATDGVITSHPGTQGIGDLDPDVHGWTDPVARITVQRIQ